VNNKTYPLLLVLLAAVPLSAGAQQNGVTVLRPGTSDTPDSGVRRVPSGSPASRQAPSSSAAPIRDNSGGSVLPAPPPSEIVQAIGSAKPLSEAEAAALGSALKAIDDGRFADASASVANFNNKLLSRIV
jgi:hypothetical protein